MRTLALVVVLVLLCSVAQSQNLVKVTTNTPTTDSLNPCSTKYYSWVVTVDPQTPRFYLEVDFTAQTPSFPLYVSLSQTAPSANSQPQTPIGQPSSLCSTANCEVQTALNPSTSCSVQVACAATAGTWYLTVSADPSGAETTSGNYQFTPKFLAIPTSNATLTVTANNDTVVIPIPSPAGNTPAAFGQYDTLQFTMPNYAPGRRFFIEAVNIGGAGTVSLYADPRNVAFPDDSNCYTLFGINKITVESCTLNQVKGTWYLTVMRPAGTTYSLKVYYQDPVIKPFGTNGVVFDNLDKQDDIIYYSFNGLQSLTGNATFVVVVDNVEFGQVQLGVQYQYLPFLECTSSKFCGPTGVSCHTTFYYCELTGTTSNQWYIGVKAISLDDPNTPVQYTVKVFINPVTTQDLTPGLPTPGTTQRTLYAPYRIQKPTSRSQWVKFHAYLDATRLDNPVDAVMYVHSQANNGDGTCYTYTAPYSCVLADTLDDKKSCSIQLDPCELTPFTDYIYVSLYVQENTDPTSYYWTREFIPYTIVATVTDPTQDPLILLDNGQVFEIRNDVVTETETNLYKVESFAGSLTVALTMADDPFTQTTTNGVHLALVYGADTQGPSCPCWNELIDASVDVLSSQTKFLNVPTCSVIDQSLFVAVTGLPDPNNTLNYEYVENQYTLTIRRVPQVQPSIDNINLDQVYTYDIEAGGLHYFNLVNIPRSALTSKSLVVKTRAHPQLDLITELTAINGDIQSYACGYTPITSCEIGLYNDGYCAITQNCLFNSDTDSRTFVVSVYPGPLASFDPQPNSPLNIFSIEYSLEDNTPVALSSGVTVAGYLQKDLYQHYVINVDPSAAGSQNLLVELYVDAGYQFYDSQPVKLFVNTPNVDRIAGNTSADPCLCYETPFVGTRKIVYIVNACGLQAGNYHFGIITNEPVYDSFPAKYTITATLQNPVIPIDFEFPKDIAFYQGQVFSYGINIPTTFTNQTVGGDTSRIFHARITATNPLTDVVEVFFSQNPPSDVGGVDTCSCYEAPYTCQTNTPAGAGFCEIIVPYCAFTPGQWYLTPYITASEEFENPTTVSTYITKYNSHPKIEQLTFTNGCGGASGAGYSVDNKNYHHFTFNPTANGAGSQDQVELRFSKVQGGSITIYLNQGNLAVPGCGVPAQTIVDGSAEVVITLACGNSYNYMSVYGASNTNNDPIAFSVYGCYTPVGAITLNGNTLSAQKISAGTSEYYSFSMGPLQADNLFPYIEAIVSNSAGLTARITNGDCSACAGSISITQPCNNGLCGPFYRCLFPDNFRKSTTYYLEMDNVGGSDATFDLRLVSATIGGVQNIPINVGTPITINASTPNYYGWQIVSFTLKPSDLLIGTQGISSADLTINVPTSGDGSNLFSRFNAGTAPTPCAGTENTHSAQIVYPIGTPCCAVAGTYYVLFRNQGTNPVTLTLNPQVTDKSTTTAVSWSQNTESATFTASVMYNATAGKSQLKDYVVNYPGPSSPYSALVVYINSTGGTTRGTWYIEKNSVAGPTTEGCYTYFDTDTIGTAVSDQISTRQYFSCGPTQYFPSDDYWFGFENADTTAGSTASFNVLLRNKDPVVLNFNQNSTTQTVNYNEYVQLMVTIPQIAYKNRQIVFTVYAQNNNVEYYIRPNLPAGDPTDDPLAGCLAAGLFSATTVNAGTSQQHNLDSCTLASNTFFIGVKGTTSNSLSTFTASVTQKDTGTSLSLPVYGQAINSATQTFNFSTPATLDIRSYITFLASNINPASTKPDLTQWTSSNDCVDFNTAYCDPSSSASTCSAIVYPCMLSPITTYYFDVTTAGSSTMDLNATLVLRPTVVPITPDNIIRGTVLPHQLAFYTTTLSPTTLHAGQSATIRLESVSCGNVEVWINKANPAGPMCNLQNDQPCKTAGCVLTSVEACRNDDWSDDYHITVRGLRQNIADIPIQFTIAVDIQDDYPAFEMIHTNEIHTIYGVVPQGQIYPNPCPAPKNPQIVPCCPIPAPASTYTYVPSNVNFVYPVEGAHFFEYQNQITLELNDYAVSAVLYVNQEDPHFCRTDITLPTCVTNALNRTCTINLNNCQWRDTRHIYIYADIVISNNITIDPRFSNNQIAIATIRNHREQYSITAVDYSDTPNYLQFALVPGETQYIVVQHPTQAQLATIPNYRFSAEIVSVLGVNSIISLYYDWDMCQNSYICSNSANCQTRLTNTTVFCDPLAPCSCLDYTLPCEYGSELNIQNWSYLRVVNNGSAPGVAKIQMKFMENELTIPPTCEVVASGDNVFYTDSLAVPSATQYWHFTLQFYQEFAARIGNNAGTGTAYLHLYENSLAVPGTCADIISCNTSSSIGCDIRFRRAGVPHLAVYGSLATTHYRLTPVLETVFPFSLTSTVSQTYPSTDTSGVCPAYSYNQWYIFPQSQIGNSNYMFVELQAVAGTTVWYYPQHITYRWGAKYCTTDATGYCFFVVACNYTKNDYYFHVDTASGPSTPAHTITVSALNTVQTPISVDQSVTVSLQYRQVQVLQLNVAQTEDSPVKNLHVDYGVTESDVAVWINRGVWGDDSCAVASFNPNPNDPNYLIPTCDIRKPSDVFFITFVSRTQGACAKNPFTVTPTFRYDDSLPTGSNIQGSTGTLARQQVTPGTTTRLRFNIGALTATDIVYVQLTNIKNGNLTHSVWKSNHIGPAQGTGYPCTAPCNVPAEYSYVSWNDVCWHCAVYDQVYVDVDASFVGPAQPFVTFDAIVTKQSWTPLTSTVISANLPDNPGTTQMEGNLAFYSADITHDKGHRIEVQVTDGQTVKVEIYGAPCDHRSVPITTYCYPGMTCTIPLNIEGNFGSFAPGQLPHTLAPDTAYIVVSGQRSDYTIRELTGVDACAPVTADVAPTCTGFTLRSDYVWGDPSTFPNKDLHANARYNELVTAFSCAGNCLCVDLPQPCLDNLKRYACDESFQSCSDQGFGLRVTAKLCAAVENTCNNTFEAAGYPWLSCFHSFYVANAAKWVDANGNPDRPPDADIDQTINGAAASGAPAGVPAPVIDTTTTTGGVGIGPVPDAPYYDPGTGASSGNSTGGTTNGTTGFDTSNSTTGEFDGNTTATGQSTTGGTTTNGQTTSSSGSTNNPVSSGDSGVQSDSSGLSGGAIAGIVVGILVGVAVIAGLIYYFVIRGGSEGAYKNFDQT